MDFQAFKELYKSDPKYNWLTDRQLTLLMYDKILDNEFYNIIQKPFYKEQTGEYTGNYVPISERRPCAKYNICKKVVDDATALLFGSSHFPSIHCADEKTRRALQLVAKHIKLQQKFLEAARMGAIGSVAIHVGMFNGVPFVQPLKSIFLTPAFENDVSDMLLSVEQLQRAPGNELISIGYTGLKKDDIYWFRRVWDKKREIYYNPLPVDKYDPRDPEKSTGKFSEDPERTTTHGLNFIPIVWIKNLAGGNCVDGECTFEGSIDLMITRDYQMSQGDRGLRYSSDPTLVVKQPMALGGESRIHGADRALIVPQDGDAKLLEISGAASKAIVDFSKTLRENGLEMSHGNRADTSKLSVAQSGKAMEMMNQDLVWSVEKLRTFYGEGGLVDTLYILLHLLSQDNIILRGGIKVPSVKKTEDISLVWEDWYPTTPDDLQKTGLGLAALTQSKIVSLRTATRKVSETFNIEDIDAEREQVEEDIEELQNSSMNIKQVSDETSKNEVTDAESD